MDEEFKPIVSHLGLYSVSRNGEVKSIARTKRVGSIKTGIKILPVKERILKKSLDRLGYFSVRLSKNGKAQNCLVHRLVALAWIGQPPEGMPHINHIDGNKQNNHVSNLEWCSPIHNINHAIQSGLHPSPKGQTNIKAKLTDEQVKDIRSREKYRGLVSALAKEFGVGRLCISRIRRGVTWAHI